PAWAHGPPDCGHLQPLFALGLCARISSRRAKSRGAKRVCHSERFTAPCKTLGFGAGFNTELCLFAIEIVWHWDACESAIARSAGSAMAGVYVRRNFSSPIRLRDSSRPVALDHRSGTE